jgi:hypothetical protein
LNIGTLNSNNNIGGIDLLLSLVFHFSFVEYQKKKGKKKKEKGMEKGALLHK